MTENNLDYRDPEWLAEQLGLDKSTIYRYLQEGALPGLQLGRKWLVSERQVVEFLDQEARLQTAVRRRGRPVMDADHGKYSERARLALRLAQEEARQMNHNYVGTEHMLIGMVAVEECVAAFALRNLGIDLDEARAAVLSMVGRGETAVTGDLDLTPRAKKVIELAIEEARRLNHAYLGTEHILMGLLGEGEGVAALLLGARQVGPEEARGELMRLLSAGSDPAAWAAASKPSMILQPEREAEERT